MGEEENNRWEERFLELQEKTEEQAANLSQKMEERFQTLLNALNNISADNKRKNMNETESSSRKRARTSVECPDPQQDNEEDNQHQVSFDDYSSDTRPYGESDEENDQEDNIVPDQQNLAEDIQQLCDTGAEIPTNNLLDGISKIFP